jgi:hypothetical protein
MRCWVCMQDYVFKVHATASMTDRSMDWCQGAPELRLRTIDSRFNFLLVLGAQKAGTTWLFDALSKHPLFSAAEHGYRCGKTVVMISRDYPMVIASATHAT